MNEIITKLRKAKTCEGCRALEMGQGVAMKCGLRFKTESHYIRPFGITTISPAEPCLKPKTYDEYFAAVELRRNT